MHVEVVQLKLIGNPEMQLQLIPKWQKLIAMILLASLSAAKSETVGIFIGIKQAVPIIMTVDTFSQWPLDFNLEHYKLLS